MVLIRLRKALFSIILSITLICCVALVFIRFPLRAISALHQADGEVNADMEFCVRYIIEEMDGAPGHLPLSDESYVPIKNARLILIDDRNGEIISTGLTDKNGEWKTNVTVSRDPRFKERNMGTVTVITVADGYNEQIQFNISVNEFAPLPSGDFIVLRPIVPGRRNEPSFEYANFHRFTVFEMLDYYAGVIGLERQPVVPGDDASPWSPKLKGE